MDKYRTVRLPSEIYDKPLYFPSHMTKDEVDAAIEKRFPQAKKMRDDYLASQQSMPSRYARDLLLGASRAGTNLLNIPNKLREATGNRLFKYAEEIPEPTRENVGLKGQEGLSDKLVSGLAQHLPSFLMPEAELGAAGNLIGKIPGIGSYVKKILGQSLPVAGYEATQSEKPLETAAETTAYMAPFSTLSNAVASGSPGLRLAGKLGLAGLGGLAGHQVSQAVGGGLPGEVAGLSLGALLGGRFGTHPKNEARSAVLEGVEGTPYAEKLKAGKRLGLSYLTPAEASGNPFVGGVQGSIGKTKEGAKLLYERGQERVKSEENAINNLFDKTYTEKLEPEKEELYRKAHEKTVPNEDLESFSDNEIIKRAKRILENKPAYKESLKSVPKNSIAYLDHVKQSLDDMIEKAPFKEARILENTRSKLISKMDEIAPEYKEARAIAERQILRRDLEKEFNKKEMRGTNFLKVLNDNKKFDEVMHHLRNVPEAQQNLKDMKLVFRDLINPPTVRTAAGLAKTSMTKERSSTQSLMNSLNNKLSGGKFDKAAVELITNPKWADELKNIHKISGKEKALSKTIDLIGRINAARNSSQKKGQ